MNKYFGWIFAAIASLTLVSAFADDGDEANTSENDDQVAVVVEESEDSE